MYQDYEEIEKEIQEKDLTAPRLTPEHIESMIEETYYHHFIETNCVVCCIKLINGYTVIGESACVSKENFDYDLGAKIAKKNAIDKIWSLEGYLLNYELKLKAKQAAR